MSPNRWQCAGFLSYLAFVKNAEDSEKYLKNPKSSGQPKILCFGYYNRHKQPFVNANPAIPSAYSIAV